ncbi:MAG: TAXI family TRAP transporter solute-binding subunit [Magnetococcales bacterium]|nr:TAXI family TRAP transporter solute-binding subunit [Magnetococcales bacterium]
MATPPSNTEAEDPERSGLRLILAALAITAAGFITAYQFAAPPPPRTVRIATGSANGAYHHFAKRYQARLAEEGITLEIQESAGSVENLHLLQGTDGAPRVDIAFVQGGTGSLATQPQRLRSVGSLFLEPLWIFSRGDAPLTTLKELEGLRIAVGTKESGAEALAKQLLGLQKFQRPPKQINMDNKQAAKALSDGRIDAALLVLSPNAPIFQDLIQRPGLQLMDFRRAEALSAHLPFLTALTLPEGILNLQQNLPATPIRLLAPAASLVVRQDLHPAIVDILLKSANEIHRKPGPLGSKIDFPSASLLEFPLTDGAERFFTHGPPMLQRYLPFWLAAQINRLKVMLLPLITLLIPLIKIMPPLYRWRIRSRIYRWYRDLQQLEAEANQSRDAETLKRIEARLEALEQEASTIKVPLSYAEEFYRLRKDFAFIRAILQNKRPTAHL